MLRGDCLDVRGHIPAQTMREDGEYAKAVCVRKTDKEGRTLVGWARLGLDMLRDASHLTPELRDVVVERLTQDCNWRLTRLNVYFYK